MNIGPLVLSVIAGVIGLAVVAVIVSQRAQTPQVLSSAGNALSAVISAAVGPVSGGATNQFGSIGSGSTGALA